MLARLALSRATRLALSLLIVWCIAGTHGDRRCQRGCQDAR